MRRQLSGALAFLLLLSPAAAARAQDPPAGSERTVAISDLIGHSPTDVRARLAAGAEGWPLQPTFQIAAEDGALLRFVAVDDLMLEAESARRQAMFRTQADPAPWTPYVLCRTRLEPAGGAPTPGGETVLLFRNDRLEAAYAPADAPPALIPPMAAGRKAQEAFIRRPRDSIFLAHRGDLPLEDAAGFLTRWGWRPLAAGDKLSVACAASAPPPAPAPQSAKGGLSASDMQGLALAPFAVMLPSKNRQRETAREQGRALLDSLRVGARLGVTAEGFAAAHKGVRVYRANADYAVASIDLGGYRGRNLTNFNDSALVGLRGDRIEWISPPSRFGPTGPLLCLDKQGVPSAPRPGCSGWGHFAP